MKKPRTLFTQNRCISGNYHQYRRSIPLTEANSYEIMLIEHLKKASLFLQTLKNDKTFYNFTECQRSTV